MNILTILLVLIVVGVILWGVKKILAVTPIEDPFKTVIWVVVVVFAVLFCVQVFFGVLPGFPVMRLK